MKTYEFTCKFIGSGETIDEAFANAMDAARPEEFTLDQVESVLMTDDDEQEWVVDLQHI